jgi:hypothetical protein
MDDDVGITLYRDGEDLQTSNGFQQLFSVVMIPLVSGFPIITAHCTKCRPHLL